MSLRTPFAAPTVPATALLLQSEIISDFLEKPGDTEALQKHRVDLFLHHFCQRVVRHIAEVTVVGKAPGGLWREDSFEIVLSSDSHVVSKPGRNVTLTCPLQTKWPVQEVRWEKIQPHQIDFLTNCNLSQGRSYGLKYRRKVESNCSEEARSSIMLPFITVADSGLYRCLFIASTGENETFVTRLTVTHGKIDNQYILFMVGGTVLFLLLVILITAAIVISCNRTMLKLTSAVPTGDLKSESWSKTHVHSRLLCPLYLRSQCHSGDTPNLSHVACHPSAVAPLCGLWLMQGVGHMSARGGVSGFPSCGET
ncbi:CD226 antigen [Galemys pyrenaicus]|uniref:CD226 antigen n=1 Tax=Galemys pyrenaicus TaxID=202257 RepID=A0A8J6DUF6_GALPY|nr:CD226 antigen [Galemys pyrenaicus]